jgi:hypothetical protein
VTATLNPPEQPVQFMLPVGIDEEPPKKPGGLFLTFLLLGIIGYAGYRVYPPLLDLWQRAHATAEGPSAPAKTDALPQTPTQDNSDVKPEAQSANQASIPAPTASNAAAPMDNTSPLPVTQPNAAAAAPANAQTTSPAAASAPAAAPPKPAAPPAPTAAQVFASKLRSDLTGNILKDKVSIQATATALTLSGSLSLAEHRELLGHLRTVPAGVRVIDDIESADGTKEAAPVNTNVGWVWVRSTPAGGTILVDGAVTGLTTPARLELKPGQHEVRVERDGVGTAKRSVVVNQGQTMQITESLE